MARSTARAVMDSRSGPAHDAVEAPTTLDETIGRLRRAVAETGPGDGAGRQWRVQLSVALVNRYRRDFQPADLDEAIELSQVDADDPGELLRAARLLLTRSEFANDPTDHVRARVLIERVDDLLPEAVEQDADNDEESDEESDDTPDRLAARADTVIARADASPGGADPAALELATTLLDTALRRSGPDQLGRLGYARRLVEVLDRRGPAAFAPGCALLRSQVDRLAAGDPLRAHLLYELAQRWSDRADTSDGPADLDTAIDAWRETAQVAAPAMRLPALTELQLALQSRFRRSANLADLDEAVATAQAALAQAADDERGWFSSLLGHALVTRYDAGRAPADLSGAVAVYVDVAALAGDPADRAEALANLAEVYDRLADTGPDAAPLDQAIEAWRLSIAVELSDEDRAERTADLAVALAQRYQRRGSADDLDEAIVLLGQALDRPGLDAEDRMGLVSEHADMLRRRYLRLGREEDIRSALAAARLGRELAADADPDDRAVAVGLLGSVLYAHYFLTGSPGALDEVVQLNELSTELAAPDHMDRAVIEHNRALALELRYQATGDLRDIDAAIDILRRIAEDERTKPQLRPGMWANLADSLCLRFDDTGRRADIDAACAAARRAMADRAAAGPDVFAITLALNNALRSRFHAFEAMSDLDEAITAVQSSEAALVGDGPQAALTLVSLGRSLRIRAQELDRPADLDLAHGWVTRALTAAGINQRLREMILVELSRVHADRFGRDHDDRDLEAAFEALTEAHALAVEAPKRAAILVDLSRLWTQRFRAHRRLADGVEAIATARAAVALDGHSDLGLANARSALAYALFYAHGAMADVEEALGLYRDLARTPQSSIPSRMASARVWALLAVDVSGDPADGLAGLVEGMAMLPLYAWPGLDRPDQERVLADHSDLASQAGASALAAGETALAVELLEQGRSVIWTHLLDGRTDPTELGRRAPDLAARLDELRARRDTADRSQTRAMAATPELWKSA